ncbi:MAG: hypothetical protein ACJ762_02865 [Solirubrobacteraceae bacterium]
MLAGAASSQAYTFVYSDIPDFNLTGSFVSYGGGTQYHVSSTGDGTASYRWVDSPAYDTIVSGNSCADLSSYGQHYYNSGVTDYRALFAGTSGRCFVLRGKTAGGAVMNGYDGRLER